MDTSTKVNNFVGSRNCLSLHIPSTRDFSRFSFFGLTTAWWTLWRTLHSIKLPKPCWLSLHQQNRHKRSSLSKPRVQHLFNKGASSSLSKFPIDTWIHNELGEVVLALTMCVVWSTSNKPKISLTLSLLLIFLSPLLGFNNKVQEKKLFFD